MPKARLKPIFEEIQGTIFDVVLKRTTQGRLIVTKRPDMSNVKWSKAQKKYRERFKQAIAYAKAAMADPKVRKVYEKMAAKENRQPFRVAVSDYLKGNDLLTKKRPEGPEKSS